MPGPPAVPLEGTSEPSYTSLEQDLKARNAKGITIPRGPGHIGIIVDVPGTPNDQPASGDPGSPSRLKSGASSPLRTATRPGSPDRFYDVRGVTMADRISSPKTLRNTTVAKQTGHISMDATAAGDPRQTHTKPAARLEIGPGAYEVDPLATHTTGMPTLAPGQSHHMIAFEKDPSRPSPAFRSPERGRSAAEVGAERAHLQVAHMLPHDYESWTSKGWYSPRASRAIESERWGRNTREPRPPPSSQPQSVYDPQIASDGRTVTISAYTHEKTTPSYKTAFGSGMPRLVALPAGLRQDTRTVACHAGATTGTNASIGPGSYENLDPPRFKSYNAALEGSPEYFSLAGGSPSLQHGSAATPGHGARSGSNSPVRSGAHSPQRSGSPTKAAASPSQLPSPMHRSHGHPGSSVADSPADSLPLSPLSRLGQHHAPWAAGAHVTQMTGPSPHLSPVRHDPRADSGLQYGLPSPPGPESAPAGSGGGDQGVVVGPGSDADWEVHRAVLEAQRAGVRELRGAATRDAHRAATAEAAQPAPWASLLASPIAPSHPVSVLPGTGAPLALSAPATPMHWRGSRPSVWASMPPSPAYSVGARSVLSPSVISHATSRSAPLLDGITVQAEELRAAQAAALAAAAAVGALPTVARGNQRFNKLMFMRRVVPQGALVRGELLAKADLRRARAQAHADGAVAALPAKSW